MLDYPSSPLSPPVPPPPRRSNPLVWILGLLAVVLAAPYLVEYVQFANTRGRMRAKAEVANEELQKLAETPALATVSDTSRVFKLVAQKIEPSVVHIDVAQLSAAEIQDGEAVLLPEGRLQQVRGQGSGFIIDGSAGYIITNRHVVENAVSIHVHLGDGRTIDNVQKVGDDELTDIAVLKIDAGRLDSAQWGDSEDLEVGDWVLAVGSPFGLEHSVTVGIVSAKQRRNITETSSYQDFLQTDAAVNPGNSGGPLVNMRGEVIGVNTAIVGRAFQGVSFAVPSEVARRSYEQIIKHGRVARGWLGIGFDELDTATANRLGLPDRKGAVVGRVLRGSPAAIAGIRQGDVILEWNGREVVDPTDLALAVAATDVGAAAKAIVWRSGQRESIEVTVGQRPAKRELGR